LIAIPTTWDSLNVRILASLLILTLSAGVSATVYESYDCSIHPDGSFSPDGTKIVYSAFDSGGRDKLFIANADGTGATAVMPDILKKEFTPDWSYDGKQIFFISTNKQGNGKICVVHTDGTGKKELMPDDPRKQWYPDVSPNGKNIVYVSRQLGCKEKLYIANIDGTGARELMPDSDEKQFSPDFSPVQPGRDKDCLPFLQFRGYTR